MRSPATLFFGIRQSNYFLILCAIVVLFPMRSIGQGFVNLDFENPASPLTPDAFHMVPTTNALPGWSAYIGGTSVVTIVYNTFALDSAAISLHSSLSPYIVPIQGSYSVFLQNSRFTPDTSAIGQTGQIGLDINSLFFLAQYQTVFSGPLVTFNGNVIPYFQFAQNGNYITFAADISSLAGQTGELRFAPTQTPVLLDGISFSITQVPEPSSIALFAIGGASLLYWHRKPRRS